MQAEQISSPGAVAYCRVMDTTYEPRVTRSAAGRKTNGTKISSFPMAACQHHYSLPKHHGNDLVTMTP
jgi:hypothetical protein